MLINVSCDFIELFFLSRYLFVMAKTVGGLINFHLSLASLNASTAHARSSITQSALGSKNIALSVLQEEKDRIYKSN